MTVYFIVIVLSIVLLSISDEEIRIARSQTTFESKKLNTSFALFCVMLMFIAGFRYRVGTDFGAYFYGYKNYVSRLSETIKTLDEPMLSLIDWIAYFFVKENIGGTLFPALITLFLILRTTFKYSTDLSFSGMLVLFTCWSSCFNGVKQALAAAVLYCGYPYLRDKKLVKYIFVAFLAFLCHKSAIIMILVYFICRNKVNARNVIFLVIGSLVILLNYDRLFGLIDTLLGIKYAYETDPYIANDINPLRVVIYCAPATYYLIKYWNREKTKLQTLCLNFVIIHAVMMIAASGSAMLGRMGMYTSTLCLIAIPELNRGLSGETRKIMKWVILAFYGLAWLYGIYGSSHLNNFQFIWQM